MPTPIQRLIALVGVVVLAPVLLAIALAVRLTSPGPALHRAARVKPGGTFMLLKFRTMRVGASAAGPGVTASGDPRVTRLGVLLRRTKLDELPQLWNVVSGDMLLVGPRPEDARFVDWDDPLHRLVLGAKPGITGETALEFRHEESLLADAATAVAAAAGRDHWTDADLDRAYREIVLPRKLAMDAEYLRRRSTLLDLRIIGRTIGQAFGRTGGG